MTTLGGVVGIQRRTVIVPGAAGSASDTQLNARETSHEK
jgi:hypothetical protein